MNAKSKNLSQLQSNYLEAIRIGDRSQAAHVLDLARNSELSLQTIYVEILLPAQVEIGNLWHQERITIADEHCATEITLGEMSRLRSLYPRSPELGLQAVIAALESDSHVVGARVVSDFLYLEGWDVKFLGGNIPGRELVNYVAQQQPNLLAISISSSEVLQSVGKTIEEVRTLTHAPHVIVGGLAVDSAGAARLGADCYAKTADEAVKQARKLVGLPLLSPSLEEYLKGLGSRIQKRRKQLGLSQQVLAKTAGLDRAYISSVEHGKQNVTIAAVLKLAEALTVPLETLLTRQAS